MPDKLDGHLLSEDLALMTVATQSSNTPSNGVGGVAAGGVPNGPIANGIVNGVDAGSMTTAPKKADHSRPCSEAKVIHKEQVRMGKIDDNDGFWFRI